MRFSNSFRGAALGVAAAICGSAASAEAVKVPLDQETAVGGVSVACTGIGQTKNDPKWQAYSVRLEFAKPNGDYLAGEVVRLLDRKGAEVLDIACEGPCVLLKLPPGKPFKVEAAVSEVSSTRKTATIKAPSHGQARFVFTFANVE
jgi:hypothetical protein